MQEDCLSIRNGWNLNAFNSGMIESDLHGFSPVCFHFNSDCLSANPNSIPSDAPKQKSLWFCTPSLFEVNDFDEIVQNLNLNERNQPINYLVIFNRCIYDASFPYIASFGLFCDLWLVAELFIQWSRWNSIMWKRTTLAWCSGNTPHDMLLPDAKIPDNFPTSQTLTFFLPDLHFSLYGRLTRHIQWDSVSSQSIVTGFGIAVYHSPAYTHQSIRRDTNNFFI